MLNTILYIVLIVIGSIVVPILIFSFFMAYGKLLHWVLDWLYDHKLIEWWF